MNHLDYMRLKSKEKEKGLSQREELLKILFEIDEYATAMTSLLNDMKEIINSIET